MTQEVIVIGAGMVGTCIAWHLQKNGSKVLLLDKSAPGSETSYGNAGLIQREAIHVHPFPRKLNEILRVLPNTCPEIRYRRTGIYKHWNSLLKYWICSQDEALAKIEKEWASLIRHCCDEHEPIIEASEAHELVRKVGWIEMHRSQAKFNQAVESARKATEHGIEYDVLTTDELTLKEPNANLKDFCGAIHWKNSWQITNPGALVKAYAKNFEAMGGATELAEVTSLKPNEDSWQVVTKAGSHYADKVVIAAGPWSSQFTKKLGYNIPLFPMRGYHRHFDSNGKHLINHSLVDMDKGFVMGPMQQGIRLTSGAEMACMDSPKSFDQFNLITRYAKEIINLGPAVESEAWCGSRPCMPDMKPIIGPASKHKNLWLAFGHGHQGFTLGAITGRIVEEMIHNKSIVIDATPFSCERFL